MNRGRSTGPLIFIRAARSKGLSRSMKAFCFASRSRAAVGASKTCPWLARRAAVRSSGSIRSRRGTGMRRRRTGCMACGCVGADLPPGYRAGPGSGEAPCSKGATGESPGWNPGEPCAPKTPRHEGAGVSGAVWDDGDEMRPSAPLGRGVIGVAGPRVPLRSTLLCRHAPRCGAGCLAPTASGATGSVLSM